MIKQIAVRATKLAGETKLGNPRDYHIMMDRSLGPHGENYGIPTADEGGNPLSLVMIAPFVVVFLIYARERPDANFEVPPLGIGTSSYDLLEFARMFREAPPNVKLPKEFVNALDREYQRWRF